MDFPTAQILVFLACIISTVVRGKQFQVTGKIDLEGVGEGNGGQVQGNVNLILTSIDDKNVVISGGEACQPLKGLLADFVYNDDWTNAQDVLKGFRIIRYDVDEVWDLIKRAFKIDMKDGTARDRLACQVYEAAKGNPAAKKEIQPAMDPLRRDYHMYIKFIVGIFGFDGLISQTDVVMEYAAWRNQTGYPDVPMTNLGTEEELTAMLEKWHIMASTDKASYNDFLVLARTILLPLQMSPQDTAKAIKDANSTKELLESLNLSQRDYSMTKKHGSPVALNAAASLVARCLQIFKELKHVGLI